jgi:glutaredoxin-related protein
MKTDRLFLARQCPDCATVKTSLNFSLIDRDNFLGRGGQRLFVFDALSNDACRELLDAYGLQEYSVPVLLMDSGTVISEPSAIVDYLRKNGMT